MGKLTPETPIDLMVKIHGFPLKFFPQTNPVRNWDGQISVNFDHYSGLGLDIAASCGHSDVHRT
jgi:hypothetical protein